MRQIVLDTETTGLDPDKGHRIIEIGCVELINRRLSGNNFHVYLNPDREIEQAAIEVHGITNDFLSDKQRFQDIAETLFDYLNGAELIIHNAPFDIGFIKAESDRVNQSDITEICTVLDTLVMARKLHPGKRNDLDSLCKRYEIDNTQRTLHGALLDAEILADVYLRMTGGQVSLSLDERPSSYQTSQLSALATSASVDPSLKLSVIKASLQERQAHEAQLEKIRQTAGQCIWDTLSAAGQ